MIVPAGSGKGSTRLGLCDTLGSEHAREADKARREIDTGTLAIHDTRIQSRNRAARILAGMTESHEILHRRVGWPVGGSGGSVALHMDLLSVHVGRNGMRLARIISGLIE